MTTTPTYRPGQLVRSRLTDELLEITRVGAHDPITGRVNRLHVVSAMGDRSYTSIVGTHEVAIMLTTDGDVATAEACIGRVPPAEPLDVDEVLADHPVLAEPVCDWPAEAIAAVWSVIDAEASRRGLDLDAILMGRAR